MQFQSSSAQTHSTLSMLRPGHSAPIIGIQGDSQTKLRLEGLGLRRGCTVELVQGGDNPVWLVKVLDTCIALNSSMAEQVRIRLHEPQAAR